MRHRLATIATRALFLSRFLTTTIPAQILLLLVALLRLRMPPRLLAYLAVVAVYVVTVLAINPAHAPISNILFYFSFIPPLLVMLSTRPLDSQEYLTSRAMGLIALVTFADAVAMNTPLRSYMWFFPEGHVHGRSMIFGFYNRPAGIAAVTSSSGALAMFMLVLSDWWQPRQAMTNRRTLWTLVTLVLLQSGTGFVMFGGYVLVRVFRQYRSRVRKRHASLFVLALIAAAVYYTSDVSQEKAAQWRFSPQYAMSILDFKLQQFDLSVFNSAGTLLLGAQIDPARVGNITSSDFAILGMLTGIGALGSLLVLIAPWLFWGGRRSMLFPLLVFYLCFLHYPAMSSPPGAVIFAVFLFMLWAARRGVTR